MYFVEGASLLVMLLMVLDAVVAIALIVAVIAQEPKSAGMGGFGGGDDTVFSGKARGLDALLARVTVILAVLFAVLTILITKVTE